MQFRKRPTEPIFKDAWNIADAIAYKTEQELRLAKAVSTEGQEHRAVRLSDDIERLDTLITSRLTAWEFTYGNGSAWFQHIEGHPKHLAIHHKYATISAA